MTFYNDTIKRILVIIKFPTIKFNYFFMTLISLKRYCIILLYLLFISKAIFIYTSNLYLTYFCNIEKILSVYQVQLVTLFSTLKYNIVICKHTNAL